MGKSGSRPSPPPVPAPEATPDVKYEAVAEQRKKRKKWLSKSGRSSTILTSGQDLGVLNLRKDTLGG